MAALANVNVERNPYYVGPQEYARLDEVRSEGICSGIAFLVVLGAPMSLTVAQDFMEEIGRVETHRNLINLVRHIMITVNFKVHGEVIDMERCLILHNGNNAPSTTTNLEFSTAQNALLTFMTNVAWGRHQTEDGDPVPSTVTFLIGCGWQANDGSNASHIFSCINTKTYDPNRRYVLDILDLFATYRHRYPTSFTIWYCLPIYADAAKISPVIDLEPNDMRPRILRPAPNEIIDLTGDGIRKRKIKILRGSKSDERIKKLKKMGYEIKKQVLPNGDTVILKRLKRRT